MAIRLQVSRLQDLVQLVRTDAPVASTTEALIRLGASFSAGDASGTYLGINAPNGYTGNFIDFKVNAAVKAIINEDGRIGIGTGISTTNFVNVSSATTNVAGSRSMQATNACTQNSGNNTVHGLFSTLRLIPSGSVDLVGNGVVSQPLYEGTAGSTQSGIMCYCAAPGIAGVSPTGTLSEMAGVQADTTVNAATGTPAVTITNRYGLLVENQGSGHGVNGLSITNSHGIRIRNQTGAGTLSRAITVDGGAVYLNAGSTSVVPLTLDAAPSGSADYFQCRVNGGAVQVAIKQSSTLGINFIERPAVTTGPFIDIQQTTTGISAINRTTASNVPFTVRGMASQSGDLQQWQTSTPTTVAKVLSTGEFRTIGQNVAVRNSADTVTACFLSPGGQISVDTQGVGTTALRATAIAAMTAELVQFRDSGGTARVAVGSLTQVGDTTLYCRAIGSQTGALQQWRDSANAALLEVAVGGHLTFTDAVNIIAGTTTGTKIATSATQKIGFWNATPVVQNTGWGSITNVTPDKAYDANATTLDEIADVLGTLIAQLVTYGILGS